MMEKSIVMIILSVIGAAFFSGCLHSGDSSDRMDDIIDNITELRISQFESTQKLKKFNSVNEIREFLKANTQSNAFYYGQYAIKGGLDIATDAVVRIPPMPMPASTQGLGTEAIASEYSKTNIQVEGVDEADFVKNDGRYIYVLAQKKLVIVDAFPATDASILSSVLVEGRPVDMFVNDEKLVVFTEDNDQVPVYSEYDYRPVMRFTPRTTALVFDIGDRKKPVQVANYSINGNYFKSRMIGEFVYFIVKDNVYYYGDAVDMPVIKQGKMKFITPDVYYFDNPEQNYVFHTIASLNLNSGKIDAKSFMMGYSDNLYVSENNIYLTYRKNFPARYYEAEREERFYRVVVPQLPEAVQNDIYAIKDSKLSSYEKWDKISSMLENAYNNMDENEKQEYLSNVEKAVAEYETKLAQEREKTVIQKIKIDKGAIEYSARGEVQGSLLNQFSMDEKGEYFRVATTTQLWTRIGSVQHNNVYVLSKDLITIGKLEGLAKDERIYSTRFIGDRLYMVTFKRMDPLFVIDLSKPENPKILGELKIPGYSDYLHPYDENHIIGVGKETEDEGWGGVSIKGVKLSLFDVSDVNNPKQLDKYEIGSAGTDSEALRDHRAFLFDKKKSLLVIPIREVKGMEREYMQRVWQGAYVFNVTPEDGFKLRGKVSHLDDYEEDMYSWNSPNAVRRALYIDDVLYTVSARKVFMNSLDNMSVINSVNLPFDKGQYYEYGWK